MVTSTFVWVVSVNSRNLVPVRVLKHCMRKFSVSSTSRPEGGCDRVFAAGETCDFRGFRRAVMAWTLLAV